jgi:hypothetical protein
MLGLAGRLPLPEAEELKVLPRVTDCLLTFGTGIRDDDVNREGVGESAMSDERLLMGWDLFIVAWTTSDALKSIILCIIAVDPVATPNFQLASFPWHKVNTKPNEELDQEEE